jgi:hypothetical protein
MASTFKNAVAQSVGVSPADIYTTPSSTSTTVIGLSLANKVTSTVTVSATMTKGGTTVFIIKDAPIPVGGSLVLFGGDQKLVLQTTDKISIISNTAASVDVVLSFLEIS